MTPITPRKDEQSVTAQGEPIQPSIHDVKIFQPPLHMDHRGELIEILNLQWGLYPEPFTYVYQVIVRPGLTRGWVVHKIQSDRIFVSSGTLRWALWDGREDSPTYKMLNLLTFSDRKRAVFNIPPGVYHAVKNIGIGDATFINAPTEFYNYENPDKYRLPLKNDLIPFDFDEPAY